MSKTLQEIEIFLIVFYKKHLSPMLQTLFGGGCRYRPVCSDYCTQAIKKYGALKGACLCGVRILKCNPYSKHSVHYPLK